MYYVQHRAHLQQDPTEFGSALYMLTRHCHTREIWQ